jgi:hypothetical protein
VSASVCSATISSTFFGLTQGYDAIRRRDALLFSRVRLLVDLLAERRELLAQCGAHHGGRLSDASREDKRGEPTENGGASP